MDVVSAEEQPAALATVTRLSSLAYAYKTASRAMVHLEQVGALYWVNHNRAKCVLVLFTLA